MQSAQDKYHSKLAGYFRNLADPSHNQQWQGKNKRPFFELPFQLVNSDKKTLSDILWNPFWHRAKINHTDIYGLLLDLGLISDDKELDLLHETIDLSSIVLSVDKSQLASQLIGRLLSRSEPKIQSLLKEIIATERGYWLCPLASSLSEPGGPLLRTMEGNAAFESVAVTADGKIVSGGLGNNLIVWDLETGRQEYNLNIHKGCNFVSAIANTPDGKIIAAVNNLSHPEVDAIEMWDVKSGQLIKTIEGYSEAIRKIAVSPEEKMVSLSYDHKLKVWDLATGKLLFRLEDHPYACGIAVTSDGRAISAGGTLLKLWDLNSGKLIKSFNSENKYDVFNMVAISSTKKIFAFSSYSLKLFDNDTFTLSDEIKYPINAKAIAVTANDKVISIKSVGSGKHILVWDVFSGKLQCDLEGHTNDINDIALTPDEKLITASSDNSLKVWDLSRESGYGLEVLNLITDIAITKGGKVITASIDDTTLRVWDLHTHKLRFELRDNTFPVQVVKVKDEILVTGSCAIDGLIKIWDLESGTLLRTLEGQVGPIYSLALTENKIVSAGGDKTVRIWDIKTGTLLHTCEGHSSYVDSLVVTPDEKAISANSYHDCKIKVWDLNSGKLLYQIEDEEEHYQLISGLTISIDGKELWGWDRTRLKVWDIVSGKVLRILNHHPLKNHGQSISMINGKIALLRYGSNTIKIWDLIADQPVTSFSSDSLIYSCSLAPDRQRIIAGDKGGRLHFLKLIGPEDV